MISIIAAGGKGQRFSCSRKKQYLNIEKKPLLYYTLKVLYDHQKINEIIVVLPREDISEYSRLFKNYFKGKIYIIEGGGTRTHSVYNGLCFSKEFSSDLVLIHDAVRPFIRHSLIDDLYNNILDKNGIIPVNDIYDTMVKISGSGMIEYLDRRSIKCVQTPQIFRKDLLIQLIEKAEEEGLTFTDESSILNHYNYEVSYIKGDPFNFKLTVKDQYDYLKYLFRLYFKEEFYKK